MKSLRIVGNACAMLFGIGLVVRLFVAVATAQTVGVGLVCAVLAVALGFALSKIAWDWLSVLRGAKRGPAH